MPDPKSLPLAQRPASIGPDPNANPVGAGPLGFLAPGMNNSIDFLLGLIGVGNDKASANRLGQLVAAGIPLTALVSAQAVKMLGSAKMLESGAETAATEFGTWKAQPPASDTFKRMESEGAFQGDRTTGRFAEGSGGLRDIKGQVPPPPSARDPRGDPRTFAPSTLAAPGTSPATSDARYGQLMQKFGGRPAPPPEPMPTQATMSTSPSSVGAIPGQEHVDAYQGGALGLEPVTVYHTESGTPLAHLPNQDEADSFMSRMAAKYPVSKGSLTAAPYSQFAEAALGK